VATQRVTIEEVLEYVGKYAPVHAIKAGEPSAASVLMALLARERQATLEDAQFEVEEWLLHETFDGGSVSLKAGRELMKRLHRQELPF
jgi:hypothetical protein